MLQYSLSLPLLLIKSTHWHATDSADTFRFAFLYRSHPDPPVKIPSDDFLPLRMSDKALQVLPQRYTE